MKSTHGLSDFTRRRRINLSKKSLRAFFAKLLSELQNQILYHYFAILPLRRVI